MFNFFQKIIKICLYLTLLAPLFVNDNFVFPYVFPKTALFQILVEVAFACWILLLITKTEHSPCFAGLTKTIAIWLVVLFFISLIGVNFYHSLWSSYERMTGLVTLFHYFAYFLILVSILKTEKEWLQIFDVSVIASLGAGLIGVFQKTGALMSPAGGRIASSFGNPSFLAAYLLFNIFFIVFLFYKKYSQSGWRFYYLIALLFNLLILFWTGTRGALLALFAGIFIFLILFLLTPQKHLPELKPATIKKLKLFILICLIISIISISLIFVFRNAKWIQNLPVLNRIVTISLEEGTVQTRLLVWQMSMEGWKERFLFGWGWENYNVVFNKFYNPHLFPTEAWFDRAHNIFFDTVVTSGLVGLLSYLAIFAVSLRVLWKRYLQDKINFLTASFFTILFIVYFIQNLFVFDMIHSYLMFFLVLGFIGFIEYSTNSVALPVNPAGSSAKRRLLFSVKSLVAIGLILIVYFINIKPALASYYTISGLRNISQKINNGHYNQDELLENFQRALNYGTFGRWENNLTLDEYILNLSDLDSKKISNDEIKKDFDFAIKEINKIIRVNPLDARYQVMLGFLYFQGGRYNSDWLYSAEKSFTKALKLSPTKQDIYFALSQVKIKLDREQEADLLLKKAIELNPSAGRSYWTAGLHYLLMGRLEQGKIAIKRAQENGYGLNPDRIMELEKYYKTNRAYEELISLYSVGIGLEPDNAQWHHLLATLYLEIGEKTAAVKEIIAEVKLNPSLADQAFDFLKGMDKQGLPADFSVDQLLLDSLKGQ